MSDQYLSTDPHAGEPVPHVPIVDPALGAHPEARMSAARPGGAPWQTEIARPGDVRLERDRADNNVLGVPPEIAVTSALPIARAVADAGAGVAAKAAAAAGAAAPQLAAQAKFRLTKYALVKMGVPEMFADSIALLASGLKKGAKAEPTVVEDISPVGVETAQEALARKMATSPPPAPVAAPGSVVPAGPAASVPVAPGPPVAPAVPPAAPLPTPGSGTPPPPVPGNGLPDQKALNEAALAARRAAYQAQLAKEVPAPAAAVANPKLLASEAKEYLRLLKTMPAKDAMASILAQRELQAQLGLTTPSAAETKFPKGMRGRAGE